MHVVSGQNLCVSMPFRLARLFKTCPIRSHLNLEEIHRRYFASAIIFRHSRRKSTVSHRAPADDPEMTDPERFLLSFQIEQDPELAISIR